MTGIKSGHSIMSVPNMASANETGEPNYNRKVWLWVLYK